MKKCKCKIESMWYLIDDSFNEDSEVIGGSYSYNIGDEYEYNIENSAFGVNYMVRHDNGNTVGFDEMKFNKIFDII